MYLEPKLLSMRCVPGRVSNAAHLDVVGLQCGEQFAIELRDCRQPVSLTADCLFEYVAAQAAIAKVLVTVLHEVAEAQEQFDTGCRQQPIIVFIAHRFEYPAKLGWRIVRKVEPPAESR